VEGVAAVAAQDDLCGSVYILACGRWLAGVHPAKRERVDDDDLVVCLLACFFSSCVRFFSSQYAGRPSSFFGWGARRRGDFVDGRADSFARALGARGRGGTLDVGCNSPRGLGVTAGTAVPCLVVSCLCAVSAAAVVSLSLSLVFASQERGDMYMRRKYLSRGVVVNCARLVAWWKMGVIYAGHHGLKKCADGWPFPTPNAAFASMCSILPEAVKRRSIEGRGGLACFDTVQVWSCTRGGDRWRIVAWK